MIPTPSPRPRMSTVRPSGNIPYQPSTLPASASPEIRLSDSRFTRMEFRDVTGLSCLAVDKFMELGFIKPFGVWEHGRKEVCYSIGDARKVRVLMTLLDGTLTLSEAHEKAEAILSGTTPKVGKKVKDALDLSPLKRFIDRPYEVPTNRKRPASFDADTEAALKPSRVSLSVTHEDGTNESRDLSGGDVPDYRDWEDKADDLWLESERSEHGPVVSIRMEDESGQPYLSELRYQCSMGPLNPLPSQAALRKG